ncbi:MAG: pyridoxal phosphate-dependent aminotransferase family protein [Epsilonproteobacteria bacterium]|nr:8-amino-7-oxononanoate synthase [Campylobacterota bacterium]NPA56299.1 pyridoxal phosphate-dependent aminotransferase family protein [Campylobacterota bacterium]
MYEQELEALKRAGRFRERTIYPPDLKDFASNDYLDLARNGELLERAYQRVRSAPFHGPRASQLVCGYSDIHREFEEELCRRSGFEGAITVGSGFLANIALIEALVRRGDRLFIDEEFHASGNLAARLVGDVVRFRHNDPAHLEEELAKGGYRRAIVAVEGVYSMSGHLLEREIFDVVNRFGALLIVDEAHSGGVVGESLLGVLDGVEIEPNYIKMGTLGKAYGSYGAYILASREIISFLENRSKSIIYTTAPSLWDIALAHEAFLEVESRLEFFKREMEERRRLVASFGYEIGGLILPIPHHDPVKLQRELVEEGYLVGAIRPPTVKRPQIRIIPRVGESLEDLASLLERVTHVSL